MFCPKPHDNFLRIDLPEVEGFFPIQDHLKPMIETGVVFEKNLVFEQGDARVEGFVIHGESNLFEGGYGLHMTGHKKVIHHPVLHDFRIERLDVLYPEGPSLDLNVVKITEILKIRKSPLLHGLHFGGFEGAVLIAVIVVDEHLAEHFIKDPFFFESGQTLFIKMKNNRMIDPHMGMGRGIFPGAQSHEQATKK